MERIDPNGDLAPACAVCEERMQIIETRDERKRQIKLAAFVEEQKHADEEARKERGSESRIKFLLAQREMKKEWIRKQGEEPPDPEPKTEGMNPISVNDAIKGRVDRYK